MATVTTYKATKLKPIKDTIIVSDMEFEERISQGGIIIPDDDMKSSGIRPRWARVFAVGPDVSEVKVGEYVYVAHGRWTRGISLETPDGKKVIRKVDNKDILMVSDEYVPDYNMSDKV